MRTIDRMGVLMDTCQKCGGVWLEPREAAKVVDILSGGSDTRYAPRREDRREPDDDYYREQEYRRRRQGHDHDSDDDFGHGKHRRRGGLRGLFDFFD